MTEPDYDNYSLEELQQAWESINRDAYPERAARIKALLDDPQVAGPGALPETEQGMDAVKPNVNRGLFYSALGLWSYGFLTLAIGMLWLPGATISLEPVWQRVLGFAVFFIIGFLLYQRSFDDDAQDASDDTGWQ